MHDATDNAPIVCTLDASHIRRQMRLNPLPLLIAQPKKVLSHGPDPPKRIKHIWNQDCFATAAKLMSSHSSYDYSKDIEPSRPLNQLEREKAAEEVDTLLGLMREYDQASDRTKRRALRKRAQRFKFSVQEVLWEHNFGNDEFVELRPDLSVRSEPRSLNREDGMVLVVSWAGICLRF